MVRTDHRAARVHPFQTGDDPLLVSSLLFAAPIPPEIEDEQALGVNKLPYHSTLVPYGTLQEALRADRTKSSYARSLNGPWRFNWVKRPEERPIDFYKPDYDVSKWKTLDVPSCWQVKGYGTPYYRNAGYIFQRDWPRVMSEPPKDFTAYDERNPVGSYRRTFEVPADWDGRETFLKFDGVDAGFFLWVNGEKVGYSQNSRNAAEFDVTKYLKQGRERRGGRGLPLHRRVVHGGHGHVAAVGDLPQRHALVGAKGPRRGHLRRDRPRLPVQGRDPEGGRERPEPHRRDTEGRRLVATLYDPQGRQIGRSARRRSRPSSGTGTSRLP